MHHLYIPTHNDAAALRAEREGLVRWCLENGVGEYSIIVDDLTNGRISDKDVRKLLRPVRTGDTVVALRLSRLGRSLAMLRRVIGILHENGCGVVTLSGRKLEAGQPMEYFLESLSDIVELDREIKAFRSSDVLHAMQADGSTLGRPQGSRRRPEKTVLFGKEEQLKRMYDDGVPVVRIMEELGVSRGTIMGYLKENGLYLGRRRNGVISGK